MFEGGSTHILIEGTHDDRDQGEEDGDVNDPNGHVAPGGGVALAGLTFRNASRAAVRLADPRGRVGLRDCRWEGNRGAAALWIDGTYVAPQGEGAGEEEAKEEAAGKPGEAAGEGSPATTGTGEPRPEGREDLEAAAGTEESPLPDTTTTPGAPDTTDTTNGGARPVNMDAAFVAVAAPGDVRGRDPSFYEGLDAYAWVGQRGGGRKLREVGAVPRAFVTLDRCEFKVRSCCCLLFL